MSYANSPPKYITTLIPKLLPIFVTNDKGQVTQAIISSSLKELAPSSSSASSLPEPSSLASSEPCGDGEEDAVKPPMTICRHAIRPTWVFTWHNSSLSTRLCDRVIMRERMENECHHHIKESKTFSKGRAIGVLTITPRRRCLIE